MLLVAKRRYVFFFFFFWLIGRRSRRLICWGGKPTGILIIPRRFDHIYFAETDITRMEDEGSIGLDCQKCSDALVVRDGVSIGLEEDEADARVMIAG